MSRRPPIDHCASGSQSACRGAGHPRAFTFVEILFAIMILGIGMIMIAGVLPVAGVQIRDMRDQLTGNARCEAGYAILRSTIQGAPADAFRVSTGEPVFTDYDPVGVFGPPDATVGRVVPLNLQNITGVGAPALNEALRQQPGLLRDRISSVDSRCQWLAFYRRDPNAPTIRLIILSMQLQNTEAVSGYSGQTLSREIVNSGNGPFQVEVSVEAPHRITFIGGRASRDDFDKLVAAPGAFVIINHSPAPTSGPPDPLRPSRNNGRIFRLGQLRPDIGPRTWDIQPGFDLAPADAGPDGVLNTADDLPDNSMSDGNARGYPVAVTRSGVTYAKGQRASAWIVGRGRVNPAAPVGDMRFAGPAQDLAVLSAEVPAP